MDVMSEARAKEISKYLDDVIERCGLCPLQDICDKNCEDMWKDVFKKKIRLTEAKR